MEIKAGDRQRDAGVFGEVLAKAFADDPVIQWVMPDPTGHMKFFATIAEYLHPVTSLALHEDKPAAAALWDPPGHTPSEQDEAGSLPGFMESLGDRIPYGLTLNETFARFRPAEPHWYLATIGTDPAAQGLGIGGALLKAGLATCDRDNLPVYLESSKAANIPFYEKYGFAVTSEIELPDGPTVWGMLRPASGDVGGELGA